MNPFMRIAHITSLTLIACSAVFSATFFTFPLHTEAQIPEFLKPSCNVERCEYVFLAKIDQLTPGETISLTGNGATDYLVSLYTFGIVVASGLAVLMIILGGAKYATSDAFSNKSEGKTMIQSALTGLVLALLSYTILRTLNENFLNVSFAPTPIDVQTSGAPAVTYLDDGFGLFNSVGASYGTQDPTGAYTPAEAPTIFGYRDGDGTVGLKGDNGLGNANFSPLVGWTHYNGGAHNPSGDPSKYSQGVAVPMQTVMNDFGTITVAKNSAYEIFVDGKSIGAFPIVDNSREKLDLTYGLVKNHIDPTVTSSNSWSGAGKNITYKPLPNYWVTNQRPAQPLIKDDFDFEPNASDVDQKIKQGGNFQIK